ncbi:hypothetical protein D3C86_2138990 [compost metagenome]
MLGKTRIALAFSPSTLAAGTSAYSDCRAACASLLSCAASAARAVLAENTSRMLMIVAINSCHAWETVAAGTAVGMASETL